MFLTFSFSFFFGTVLLLFDIEAPYDINNLLVIINYILSQPKKTQKTATLIISAGIHKREVVKSEYAN